ncbi:hypothetical protein QBC36DRAFT_127657 [Triangularia setosa]|uniref:Uncharacterized protein n=1 Tax=Triangularia setosa TaxID=2587417 RepID=A0AAN6VVR7_9PEZI|nr:hypothetical protein QBC36DRAFT_127657 [Podospora setosa]
MLIIPSDIQELASQVVCYPDEMKPTDRDDLLRLLVLPQVVQTLNNVLHEKISEPISQWARERKFGIEPAICNGPAILWLKYGGLECPSGKIVILIIVPRPRHRGEIVEGAEAATSGVVKSPIGGGLSVSSVLECHVGDIIVLEGNEQLLVRDRDIRGICMFCVMHRMTIEESS